MPLKRVDFESQFSWLNQTTIRLWSLRVLRKTCKRQNVTGTSMHQKSIKHSIAQVALGKGIEIFRDTSLPEIINDDGKEVQPPILSSDSKVRHFSRKKLWISVAATLILIFSIAFGIGFGLRAKKTDKTTSSNSNMTAISRSPVILKNSSLAALSLSNGDRRLFYQEHTGQIEQAAYSSSSRSWPSTLTLVVASDARNYTPLAAVNLVSEGDVPADDVHTPGIYLFYVASNGSLAVTMSTSDGWSRPTDENGFCDGGISQFVAQTGTRSLSVTEIPDHNSTRMVLIYENSNGSVAMMEGTSFKHTNGFLDWKWQDLTSKLQSSVPLIKLGSRFSSLYTLGGVQIFFYENESNVPRYIIYENDTFNDIVDYSRMPKVGTSEMVLVNTQVKNDVPIWGVVSVNGTRLSCQSLDGYTVIQDSPAGSYPYSKSAAASGNSSIFYVYHQIDGNNFGEDQADLSVRGWIPSNFTVPTS